VQATRLISAGHPQTAVVVLTAQDDDDSVYDAVRAGIAGYLSKAATLDEFQAAVDGVRAGGMYIHQDVAGRAVRSLQRRVATLEHSTRAAALSEREREVLSLVAQGLGIRDVAARLGMTDRTVNTHVGHAYRKLGVTNRVDAVLEAFRLGIAEPPG
jgi:DNA-binding NarL/FixJ family response regulator